MKMDKPNRVRRVTVRTVRTFIFRNRDSVQFGWCAQCATEVAMVYVERAAREAGLGELVICKLIEERALHFREDTEGRLIICVNSIKELKLGDATGS
jgi:hypothetical protein